MATITWPNERLTTSSPSKFWDSMIMTQLWPSLWTWKLPKEEEPWKLTRSSTSKILIPVYTRAASLFPRIECWWIAKTVVSHTRDVADYLGMFKVSYAQKWSLKIRRPWPRLRIWCLIVDPRSRRRLITTRMCLDSSPRINLASATSLTHFWVMNTCLGWLKPTKRKSRLWQWPKGAKTAFSSPVTSGVQ